MELNELEKLYGLASSSSSHASSDSSSEETESETESGTGKSEVPGSVGEEDRGDDGLDDDSQEDYTAC